MKKKIGTSLVEYILPLALFVLIAGLAILGLYNSGFITNIFTASSNSKIDATTKNATANAKSTPYVSLTSKAGIGAFGAPLTDCKSGVCSIDFGGYILRAIPENYSDLSTAAKGVDLTQKYVTLLEALAAQARDSGVPDWALIEKAKNLARKMSLVEDRMNDIVADVNNYKAAIMTETGGKFKKMKNFLSSIDTTNFQRKDINKMLAAANYSFEAGLTDQDQLDKTTKILLTIRHDFPSLKPWQNKFINSFVNKPALTISKLDSAVAFLDADDNNMILYEGSDAYNRITKRTSGRLNWISSTGTAGPGQNLKDLIDNELPSSGLPPEMKKLVEEMGKQVLAIGDGYETTETDLGFGSYKKINLSLVNDGSIKTNVLDNLINAVTTP